MHEPPTAARGPIAFLHVPKAAGTSVLNCFIDWFGPELVQHYYDENSASAPSRASLSPSTCVFGHFDRSRGLDLESCYPDIPVRFTILRDWFDICVSTHFYLTQQTGDWQHRPQVISLEKTLSWYLANADQGIATMLDFLPHWPADEPVERYVERCFDVAGTVEALQDTLDAMADRVGRERRAVGRANASTYSEPVPDLRAAFAEAFPREHELFRYVAQRRVVLKCQ